MIRINLLPKTAKARAAALPTVRGPGIFSWAPLVLGILLVVELVAMGVWSGYSQWKLTSLRTKVTALRAEDTRLGALLMERAQFERTKQDLERRLGIISRLERSQGVPVALMDSILRSVPQGIWLTALDLTPLLTKREEKIAAATPGVIERLTAAQEKVAQPQPAQPQSGKGKDTRTVTELTGFKVTLQGRAMSNIVVADFLDNLRRIQGFRDVDVTVLERVEVEKVRLMTFTATWGIPL
jgi:Tfp pilus assembly protein PilN